MTEDQRIGFILLYRLKNQRIVVESNDGNLGVVLSCDKSGFGCALDICKCDRHQNVKVLIEATYNDFYVFVACVQPFTFLVNLFFFLIVYTHCNLSNIE